MLGHTRLGWMGAFLALALAFGCAEKEAPVQKESTDGFPGFVGTWKLAGIEDALYGWLPVEDFVKAGFATEFEVANYAGALSIFGKDGSFEHRTGAGGMKGRWRVEGPKLFIMPDGSDSPAENAYLYQDEMLKINLFRVPEQPWWCYKKVEK